MDNYFPLGQTATITTLRDERRSDEVVFVVYIENEKLFLKSAMRIRHRGRWTKNIKRASQFLDPFRVKNFLEGAGFVVIQEY